MRRDNLAPALTAVAAGAAAWAFTRNANASLPLAYSLPAGYTPADIDDADAGAMVQFAQRIGSDFSRAAPFLPTGADYADALPGSPLYDGAMYAAESVGFDPWSSDDAEIFDPAPAWDFSQLESWVDITADAFGEGVWNYPGSGGIYQTAQDTAKAVGDNVGAFLAMIRAAEGTADEYGYQALYGYKRGDMSKIFTDFSDHPRVRVMAHGRPTSVAGAYQMQIGTWDDARRALGLPDFSPQSQDRAAVWLIDKRHKALPDVIAGKAQAAINRLRKEWDSFNHHPMEKLLRHFYEAMASRREPE